MVAQATVHVESDVAAADFALLGSWLTVHAGQLLSLKLPTYWYESKVLRLPLDKLTQLQFLQLHGIKLLLPSQGGELPSSYDAGSMDTSSGGSSWAAWPALSSLQQLELKNVKLACISSLLRLTKAPQFTSLVLGRVSLHGMPQWQPYSSGSSAAATNEVADAVPGLLQQLPLLSVLHMPGFPFRDAAMQQMAIMTRLKDTYIDVKPEPACDLQQLPSSLTQLQLHGPSKLDWYDSGGPEMPSELPQLTGLLSLKLWYYRVPPKVLGTLTQMQVLHLNDCALLPWAPPNASSTTGTDALLQALHKLTCLQDLCLYMLELNTDSNTLQQFSALRASSHLTRLFVTRANWATLPKGAVQHMFSPARQLQALQRLPMSTNECQNSGPNDWCIDSAGLLSIMSSCPRLLHMDITGSVQPGADLSPLLQLPQSCTSLYMGGAAFSDTSMHVLLQLQQLKELTWECSPKLTDLGLEQLTALDLRSLCVEGCGLSEVLADAEESLKLESSPQSVSAQQAARPNFGTECHVTEAIAAQAGDGRFWGKPRSELHGDAFTQQLLSWQGSTWHALEHVEQLALDLNIEPHLACSYVHSQSSTPISIPSTHACINFQHSCLSLLLLLLLLCMVLKGSVSQQLDVLGDSSPMCAPVRLERYRQLLQAAAVREEDLRRRLQQRDVENAQLLQQLAERGGGSSTTAT
jgi:Leucine-rich repeat (LRR) protein